MATKNSDANLPKVCPKCWDREGVPLVFGFPSADDFERESRGEVILGGCVVDVLEPDRACRACGHRWSVTQLHEELRRWETAGDDPAMRSVKNRRQGIARNRRATQSEYGGKLTNEDFATSGRQPQAKEKVSLWPTILLFALLFAAFMLLMGPLTCADGWGSSSIGRAGACSHHGGVSRWPSVVALFVSAAASGWFHVKRIRRAERGGGGPGQ